MNKIPFNIQISPKEGRITLTGDLDASDAVYQECMRALKDAKSPDPLRTQPPKQTWMIEAAHARLHRGGSENWSKVVMNCLDGCKLIYDRSTLAMNLAYDERYIHADSYFHEDDSPAPHHTGTVM